MNAALQTALPEHFALAANSQLAENSRQGFTTVASTIHWASGFVISSNTLGLSGSLYGGDAGSRCTGKERDTESGNDYFEARYYACSMGRFMSPDWAQSQEPIPYAKVTIRRRLNLYSYVQNNPLTSTDPTGHEGCCDLLPTMDEVDAVAKPLIDSAVTGVEDAAGVTVQGALGVVGFLFTAGVGSTATASHDQLYNEDTGERYVPEPQAASGGAMKGGRGGQNDDTIAGQDAHRDFSAKAKAKGWQVEPRLIDPKTGKTVKPDAVTKTGKPVELKPNTASGRAKGRSQLKKYERATGKKGRVIYHGKPQQPNQ